MSTTLRRGAPRAAATVMALFALLLTACGGDESDAAVDGDGVATTDDTAAGEEGSGGDAAVEDLSEDLNQEGFLTVGTAIGNPPWASVEEGQDDPVGFDMDLITALAEQLDLEANIQVAEFPSLIPSLESGRYDAVISSLTVTAERAEVVDLLGYVRMGTGVLVPAGNPDGIAGLEDACGYRVGVAQGSANEIPVKEAQKGCGDDPIEIVQTQGNDFVALQSGQVDLMVLDASGALHTADTRPDEFEALEDAVYGVGLAGIATNKDDTALRDALQAALEDLVESGEYQRLLEQHGLGAIAYEGAEINPDTGE